MSFFKDSKNRIITYMVVCIVIVIAVNVILRYDNNRLKSEYKSMEFKYDKLLDALEYRHYDGLCYSWILDENENGFASPTEYCAQLKFQCDADFHNVYCEWIDSQVIDRFGESINKTVEGCVCKLG